MLAPDNLRALRIDPLQRVVEILHLDPSDITVLLNTEHPETMDLGEDHCLVIDGSDRDIHHTARFRMKGMTDGRPFFGVTLVLGLVHRSWAPATLQADAISASITWEIWDPHHERYIAYVPVPG